MIVDRIILEHQARYPQWQVQDVYKLLHQAAMGSGHAVSNREQARRWLEEEMTHLESPSVELLIDPISHDGQILRVHLVPFALMGCAQSMLMDAFLRTAEKFTGSAQVLESYLTRAIRLAEHGDLHLDAAVLEAFIEEKRANRFPAVHHSALYQEQYHPAYRVVCAEYLEDEIRLMGSRESGTEKSDR